MFRFRKFRTRLTVFFLGLLLLVQGAAFIAIDLANSRNARQQINANLEVDARVFSLLLDARRAQLLQAARLLSADYAFKSAFASGDKDTLLSALHNHQARIGSEVMILFSLEDDIIASTLPQSVGPEAADFSALLQAAGSSENDEATIVMMLDTEPYQIVLVPLLAPLPVARIGIGFVLDTDFVQTLKDLTLADITLLRANNTTWQVNASTLSNAEILAQSLDKVRPAGQSFVLEMAGSDTVTLMQPVGDKGALQIILQRPLSVALAPYQRLRIALMSLTAIAFIFSLAGASMIARGVTKPVQILVSATRRIQKGDYANSVAIKQSDEIGELATAFNQMTKGLAERDQVRDLLGKVVDPAVAEQLLERGLELGGEEREVTILFSDIRGFTTLSESRRPAELLDMLNHYLTRMSAAIEDQGGVVDKYIGDSVMALFGAPISHDDDGNRALRAGLKMNDELKALNSEFLRKGFPEIQMGIGINTGLVVAGNMGSARRLNYTVIGDTVNLASRIEGLTRFYDVPLIVSESTAEAASDFSFRELDIVRVKGKKESVKIFAPLPKGAENSAEISLYHQALRQYRARRWHEAEEIFSDLNRTNPSCTIYSLYLKRLTHFKHTPPSDAWDGVEVIAEKSPLAN